MKSTCTSWNTTSFRSIAGAIALALGLGASPAFASTENVSAMACVASTGAVSSFDTSGTCVASAAQAVNTLNTGSTGTMATPLDDTYIKVTSGADAAAVAATAGDSAVAIGANAHAQGDGGVAVGGSSQADFRGTAIGGLAEAGLGGTAVGSRSSADGVSSVALGYSANASGTGGIALGTSTSASADAAMAIGLSANASGNYSLAFGYLASASSSNSVALGSNAVADRDNTVSVGSAGNERQITNVADGTQDTDAVNLRQLKSAGLVGSDGSVLDAVTYAAGSNQSLIALGGTMGTQITNVMAGTIAPGSMDAVNGGQLWDMQEQVNQLGDRLTVVEAGGPGGQGGPMDPVTGGPITDNGGKIIGNVGDGVAASDAATVGQVAQQTQQAIETAKTYTDTQVGAVNQRLDQFQTSVDRRFQQQDRRISRVGSMSMAQSQMAANMAGLSGQNRVGVGVGNQSGQAALAVGFQRALSNNRASISVGASASGSETSVGMGGGFSW